MNLEIQGLQGSNMTSQRPSYSFQQGPSVAERTICQYTSGGPARGGQNSYAPSNKIVDTKTHPETGLQHQFDKENNFLSKFPVDFRGYFNCGQTDHNSTKNCPAANNGNFNKLNFFLKCGLINLTRRGRLENTIEVTADKIVVTIPDRTKMDR